MFRQTGNSDPGASAHGELLTTGTGGGGGGDVNLVEVDGVAITLGQKTMAASLPVVIASNQSAIDVNVLSGGGSNASVGATGAAVPASGTYVGLNLAGNLSGAVAGHGTAASALRVELPTDGTGVIAGITNAVTVAQGTATNLKAQAEVYQGAVAVGAANPLQVSLANTGANGTAIVVNGSGVTQPVSGTVTANAGTNLNTSALALEATLSSLNAKVTAVNTGAVVLASGTTTVTQATGTNLHTVVDSGVITTVSAVTAITNALPAGTNAIGKLAANSGVDIGDVDVTSVIPGAAATNLGKAEDAGHTTGDTGVFALAVRQDSPDTAVSGTTADYSQISVSSTGAVRHAPMSEDFAALANGPQAKKYYANTGAVTDGIVWSPAAGKRFYVTDLIFTISAAATVTFEDDQSGGDVIVLAGDFAANSGLSHHFSTPLFSGEDAADLIVTTTAGNIKVTALGYEI